MDNEYSFLDKHFSKFLADRDQLTGKARKQFQAIIQRLTSGLENGSSCIVLSEDELEIVKKSRLLAIVKEIDQLPQAPLVLFGNNLYLQRYFHYESRLARQLKSLSKTSSFTLEGNEELLDLTFGRVDENGEENYQRLAAEKALRHPFLIVSGGPGTGKTTTVVRIIAILFHSIKEDFNIALCAPTGKAAQRLYESVRNGLPFLPESLQKEAEDWLPESAMTLHRLLGYKRNSTKFISNHQNPLPYDLILVDEASMVDLALMSKLVDALKTGCRLILLGDKDQLASVESGTVLSAALKGLPANSVELKKTYRFAGDIKVLAETVKGGQKQQFLEIVEQYLLKDDWQQRIEKNFSKYIALAEATDFHDLEKLFVQLKEFMVLCCIKKGSRGVEGINTMVETSLYLRGHGAVKNLWYAGRPVLVTRNDYNLGLYNGDIGICLEDDSGKLRVWFEDGRGFKWFPTAALHNCETLYAMTVHKSQGSEFDEVMLVFPETDNRLLCRELLYTGITRAKKKIHLVAEEEVLLASLARVSQRGTGLTEMLEQS